MEPLVTQLMSPDNAIRGQAEAMFAQAKTQPEQVVSGLMEVLLTSASPDVRGLVAVLLRTSIFCKLNNMWDVLSPSLQTRVKGALLTILTTEAHAPTRHKVIDTLCELAGHIFNRAEAQQSDTGIQQWPELLAFLFQASQHEQPAHRDTGLRIFTRLSAFLGPLLTGPHLNTIKQIFAKGLVDADIKVRLSALSATISFTEQHFDDGTRRDIQSALPKMAEVVTLALKSGLEEDARAAIGMFIELAEGDPLFFRPHIAAMCSLMSEVTASSALEPQTRQYALEFLVTLCEQKPGMMAKINNFFPALVKLCVSMLLEVENDPDWFNITADSSELSNPDVAAECLDRLCLALTGRHMLPILQQALVQLLKSPDWKQRHAGLGVICIMGQGCKEELADSLQGVLQMVVPYFKDEHPRVRYASLNALGQLCTDFGPSLQEEFGSVVVPMLLALIETESVPKVLGHACAVTVNWTEHLDPVHLQPYLNRWMTALQRVVRDGHLMAKEHALVAVAALAECLQDKFVPYYDGFMPLCKALVSSLQGKETRHVQGKCVDAITVMAASVGPQKFGPDAAQILPAMVAMQQTKMDDDDPMINHLMQGWARVCSCLKEAFVPYLPVVMPSTLEAAARTPDVQLADGDNVEKLQREGVWDFRTLGTESFACRTSALQEKATAINMIYCYAMALNEHFMPFVPDAANIVVPLLNYYLDTAVRSAVCGVIPKLFQCAVANVTQRGGDATPVKQLWLSVYPTLLESINSEPDVRLLAEKCECLRDTLIVLKEGAVNGIQQQAALRVLMGVVLSVLERKQMMVRRQEEEDFDDTERTMLESENEFNEQLLMASSDLHCQLIKTLPDGYLQSLSNNALTVNNITLLKMIVQMTESPITSTDLQVAICMMDDVIEFGGPPAASLYPQFLPRLIKHMDSVSPEVRQAAVYGVGVFFHVAPSGAINAQMVNALMKKLGAIITAPKARAKKNAAATENAISAFGKAIEYRPDLVEDLKGATETWIRFLPVNKDKIEARVTYARLLRFIGSNNKFIWGDNLSLLPNILNVLVQVLGSKLIEVDAQPQVMASLKGIQTMPQAAVQAAVAQLAPEVRQKLEHFIASGGTK